MKPFGKLPPNLSPYLGGLVVFLSRRFDFAEIVDAIYELTKFPYWYIK
jgi:hypothetical protein